MNSLMLILFLVCFICLIVGLIKPTLVIKWGNKRNRKQVILTYCLGMLIFFVLFGITIPDSEKTTTVSNSESSINKDKDEDSDKELNDKIKELEDKYTPILESDKKYAEMTNDEGKIAEDIISNWNSLSDDFKEKYNDSKNKLNNSIKEYKKQKEDEEKARKEAEQAMAYDTGITYNQLARTPDDYKNSKVKFSGKVLQVMEGDKETDLRIAVDGNYDTVIFVGYDPKITSVRILEDDYVTIKGKSIGIYTYQSTMGGNISIPGIWVDKIEIN
ncbi:hypothetical protein ACQPVA_07045 [Clostridium butyricum]|uniref:hypothetical protein n=1 Tax=Clostridium butyricum TaxID=1492 RepID=UPI003D32E18A